MVGTDILYVKKRPYLIVVEYFSKFIINYLPSLTAAQTMRSLRSVFTRHGIPEIVRSDNGPQYDAAEFAKLAKDWEFKHVTSSPFCAQSNGEAERALQTAKNLLKKEEDPQKPFSPIVPHQARWKKSVWVTFWSPDQNQPPCIPASLKPNWLGIESCKQEESERKIKQKHHYDSRYGVKELQSLQPGDRV